jgi:hypothetical protein
MLLLTNHSIAKTMPGHSLGQLRALLIPVFFLSKREKENLSGVSFPLTIHRDELYSRVLSDG